MRRGPAPQLAWFNDSTVHVGAKSVTIADGELLQVAVLKDRLVTREFLPDGPTPDATAPAGPSPDATEENPNVVRVRGLDGELIAEYPAVNSRIVTNANRNIVAWVDKDGTPKALQDGQEEPVDIAKAARGASPDAVAVLGDDCAHGPEIVPGAGCTVFYTVMHSTKPAALLASNHGFVDTASDKITDLQDVSTRQAMVGLVRSPGGKLCSRYEGEEGTYTTCTVMPRTFSPDDAHLTGFPAEVTEGPAMDRVSILSAKTGKPVLTARAPNGRWMFWDAAWEDNSHLLLVVNRDNRFAMVRLGLDGTMERALAPVRSKQANFGFAVQP